MTTPMYNQTQGPLFQRLPVELQAEVFDHCTPPYSHFGMRDAPLVLGQVCTSWRNVSLSTPRLWSRFEIDVRGHGSGAEHRRLLNIVVLWLKRSATFALSIRIIHQPVSCTAYPCFFQLLAILSPHTHRLRDIDLCIPISAITPSQRPLPDRFSSLKSLSVITSGGRSHFDPGQNMESIGIPWNQLTYLHLYLDYDHLLTLEALLDILAQSVNLVECTINADSTFDKRNRNRHNVVLPKLGYLHLILECEGQVSDIGTTSVETPQSLRCLAHFLEQLQLTELHTLVVESLVQNRSNKQYWTAPHPALVSELQRFTTLRQLTLTYLPIVEQDILDSLVELPNLLQLDLRFSLADREHDPVSDDFLRACTISSCPSFLPLLERIHLQCHGAHCTTSLLLGLIHSRWTPGNIGGTQLKVFTFISMKPIWNDVRQMVRQWNEAGLVVDIESITVS